MREILRRGEGLVLGTRVLEPVGILMAIPLAQIVGELGLLPHKSLRCLALPSPGWRRSPPLRRPSTTAYVICWNQGRRTEWLPYRFW